MKTVRHALLLVLFGLLVRPAFAAPGPATLIAPSGDVVGTSISFSWESVPESTWYLFWLGKGTPTAFVMQQWYNAEQAGCANGGTCTISLTPPTNGGGYVWFIQTWGAGATGPWSAGKVFLVVRQTTSAWDVAFTGAERFQAVLGGDAIVDRETGLVWERVPSAEYRNWRTSFSYCVDKTVAGRKGWRLPSVQELATLYNPTGPASLALPAGHPFVVGLFAHWTETSGFEANTAYIVSFTISGAPAAYTTNSTPLSLFLTWCVRGGAGRETQ